MININYDKSSNVLEKSRTLKEYSYFIHQVKSYKNQKLPLGEAVEQAMKDCIRQGVLKRVFRGKWFGSDEHDIY